MVLEARGGSTGKGVVLEARGVVLQARGWF